MENINGLELIRRLGEKLYPVQFIVLSGYDDFAYVREAFQSGAVDYLLKPVLTVDLQRTLETACINLRNDSQVGDTIRSELFRHARSVLDWLIAQPHDASAVDVPVLIKNGEYRVALFCYEKAVTRIEMNRTVNYLYDCFGSYGNVLCNSVSDSKLCLLAGTGACERLAEEAQSLPLNSMLTDCKPLAAAVSRLGPVSMLPRLFYEAEKQLGMRLHKGYGRCYTPSDIPDKRHGFNSSLKQQINKFIQAPSFPTLEIIKDSLGKSLGELPWAELCNFYQYINEILDFELTNKDLIEFCPASPSFFEFNTVKSIENFIYERLQTYAHLTVHKLNITDMTHKAKAYVDEHFFENLTLADLANRFFVSYSHLSKSFTKNFQMNFHKYLLMRRMEYALELLHQSDKSVQEIAAMSGYENMFNFSRAFKTYYGIAPNHFRKGNADTREASTKLYT
jgi:YesN/AraC family two-component response regulator